MEEARQALRSASAGLFKNCSNLVSAQIQPVNGECLIHLTVPCKGFVPWVDPSPLPNKIGRFRCKVLEGWLYH
jgi:hypothetical protein